MNFIRLKIILGYLGFLPFAFFTILPMIFGEVLAIWSLQILSIYGGKLTTYRKLAENVLLKLKNFLPQYQSKNWTSKKLLPNLIHIS